MKTVQYLVGLLAVVIPAGALQAETIFGLTNNNNIVTFDSATPQTVTSTLAISGLAGGTVLTGLDLRPSNGLLYSVSTAGSIYSFTNVGGGYQATLVSTLTTTPSGSNFGIDFNPMADRLRLISNTGQNLRAVVETGATTVDTAITNGDPRAAQPAIIGSAYTNNVAGATSTALYAIDGATSRLLLSTAPNGGVYNNVGTGTLGIALTDASQVGFDISGATGIAYLSTGGNNFYTVSLTTGLATQTGVVGGGALRQLIGLTAGPVLAGAVPEPATWGMLVLGFGLVGGAARRRRGIVQAA